MINVEGYFEYRGGIMVHVERCRQYRGGAQYRPRLFLRMSYSKCISNCLSVLPFFNFTFSAPTKTCNISYQVV